MSETKWTTTAEREAARITLGMVPSRFEDIPTSGPVYPPGLLDEWFEGQKAFETRWEAYCLQCCGGGKSLGRFTKAAKAERAATSHMSAYGHKVTVIKSVNA